MRSLATLSIAVMLAAVTMTGAMAQTFTATNSATGRQSGGNPASEGTSKSTLAAEASSHPGDAGYGQWDVVDISSLGLKSVTSPVTSLSLNLTEFNGNFGVSGPLDFFLASNTTPLTGTGSEGFTYGSEDKTDGIGTQLGTLTSLGSQSYTALTTTANGGTVTAAPLTYTFALNAAQQAALASDLAAGDVKIAFGVAPGGVGATEIDGVGYVPAMGTYTTPTLVLTPAAGTPAVPEASTTVSFGLLLAFGLGGLVIARRRKVTAN